ncbi:hypothetical protein [uncultured Pontibacter sp.]|uniref:hypothetical protein n=1 Tax=uncultured Pontibacter sp. TaxID=453356 RepID=UPI002604C9BC|nr:hypothetical protein [uncultured Pontibacter sp.]
MKESLLVILVVLALASCEVKHDSSENKVTTKFEADSLEREKLRYSIINDAKQANFISEGDTTLWTPTKEQVDQIFSLTRKSISANEDKFSRYLKADSLDNSYKQIICYVDSKGDSLVFINGLCEIGDYPMEDSNGKLRFYRQDWQNRLILVSDGGDCYWRAFINFSKKKVEGPFANGEA